VDPEDKEIGTATTSYGCSFTSMVNKGNVHVVQFYLEKSKRADNTEKFWGDGGRC
jgi:imidazoleglycerol phosphate synthase glutamine amidotransferase subunit HisH